METLPAKQFSLICKNVKNELIKVTLLRKMKPTKIFYIQTAYAGNVNLCKY